jgi:hypothetical protein
LATQSNQQHRGKKPQRDQGTGDYCLGRSSTPKGHSNHLLTICRHAAHIGNSIFCRA